MADDARRSVQRHVFDQLERLSELLEGGVVTQTEFDEQKARKA
jgi:hypothetical protein